MEVSTVVVGVPGGDNSAGKNVGAATLIDNGSESTSLVYSMQKASGLASSGRLGQVISVVGGDLVYDEDVRDVVLRGAPGSKATSRGTYYNATTSGLSVWESGMYFATQAWPTLDAVGRLTAALTFQFPPPSAARALSGC